MARFAVATFMQWIGRRCMARPAGAALTALGLGSAVAGGAMALSPTVDTTLVFRGGVNFTAYQVLPAQITDAYTVPAGRKFMLTDLVIANQSETSPATSQQVFTGPTNCGGSFLARVHVTLPAAGTQHLPLVTGLGFTAGQHVCIRNGDSTESTLWTIRGFLFE